MSASLSIANSNDNLNHRDALASVLGESRTAAADVVSLRETKAAAQARRAAQDTATDWAEQIVGLITAGETYWVGLAVDDFASAIADSLACRQWRATHGNTDEAALDNARLLRALAASLTESADWIQDEVAA